MVAAGVLGLANVYMNPNKPIESNRLDYLQTGCSIMALAYSGLSGYYFAKSGAAVELKRQPF
jgi:hypothetical protein